MDFEIPVDKKHFNFHLNRCAEGLAHVAAPRPLQLSHAWVTRSSHRPTPGKEPTYKKRWQEPTRHSYSDHHHRRTPRRVYSYNGIKLKVEDADRLAYAYDEVYNYNGIKLKVEDANRLPYAYDEVYSYSGVKHRLTGSQAQRHRGFGQRLRSFKYRRRSLIVSKLGRLDFFELNLK